MALPEEIKGKDIKIYEEYEFKSRNIPIKIYVLKKEGEFTPTYFVSIPNVSENTEIILDQIRNEMIKQSSFEIAGMIKAEKGEEFEEEFEKNVQTLIKKYLPDIEEETLAYLSTYLIQKSIGLGRMEIIMGDPQLEEIAINNAKEPIWVYHRKYGWCKSNVFVKSEEETKHYSSTIGRKVDRQITILDPLLDANLKSGDRLNATLNPISLKGNTITLRKFSSKPWTITDFIKNQTTSVEAASILWLCIQYEMSIIIAGGTASGKTSMLNVVANFFPPNQRILSIEDTHELRLPKFLHWLPMLTRVPNPEGKGGVSMLDLLVNSLRMRPDRIIVGEIRRKKEAEVLFEAIHTGHSVYATVHANSAEEAVTRLSSPPIDIPKSMLPAISLVLVQYRNRRTGLRRTFQIAEVTNDAKAEVLLQFNQETDQVERTSLFESVLKSKSQLDSSVFGSTLKSTLFNKLKMFTGMSVKQIIEDLEEKKKVLEWMAILDINSVDEVGRVMATYYTDKETLMESVKKKKPLK
jgi:archaeal flagellar protein FlaI